MQSPLPDNTQHLQQTESERPQTHALDGAATGIGSHGDYTLCFKLGES